MGKMYNVLAHVFCQQKITLFLLVNSVLFVPLGNLFCKSFKIFDLSLRFWLYFCLVDCVLTVTVLVHLGVGDDCLQHEFGIPEKIEGGCVGCFPPSLISYPITVKVVMADLSFFHFFKRLAVVWHSINSFSPIFWYI